VPAPVAIANRERLDVADEEYLTPAQVADELHVTVVTVRRWIANRELRAMKAGPRRWTIRRSDLNAFLAAGRQSEAVVEISEDPSFSRHLVAPDER
jgi:excisionase family DNA binding protein